MRAVHTRREMAEIGSWREFTSIHAKVVVSEVAAALCFFLYWLILITPTGEVIGSKTSNLSLILENSVASNHSTEHLGAFKHRKYAIIYIDRCTTGV